MVKNNFKNRIVDSGLLNPEDIKMNPLNWRKHPELQQKAMMDVLEHIGWIQDVIINKTTGNLIDGHLRVETALKNGEDEIPVKYVELSEDEEKTALATFDPLSAMAEVDEEAFKNLVSNLDTEVDMTKFGVSDEDMQDAGGNPYTMNVNIPQYEITGELPSFDEMLNTDKSEEFIKEIKESNVTDEEKKFLISAAYRHNVFNYKNIAEYYAHASPEMQRLMEKSALVIIDLGNAIANGYVVLRDEIAALMDEDNEEE